MERLTVIDGIGQNELARCFDCCVEKSGTNLENCGMCEHWQKVLDKLAAYENTGYTPENFDRLCREMSDLRTALALPTYESLRDVIHSGRLVLLPVKPALRPGHADSCVYVIEDGEITTDYVTEVVIGECDRGTLAVVYSTHDGIAFRQECFGKTVFRTEKDANAALAGTGREGDSDKH